MSTPILDLEPAESPGSPSGQPAWGGGQSDELAAPCFNCNSAPPDFAAAVALPEGFLDFLLPLHRSFTPRQQELIAARAKVLKASHRGDRPEHLSPSGSMTSEWKIELPSWCADQRNQMTGPADDAELVVKMLNSGAPGVMLDLEDSMANQWPNLMEGIKNILSALDGTLTYFDRKRSRTVSIEDNNTAIWTRARGLHINQAGVLPGNELMSASLFDVALVFYSVDFAQLKHPLAFYIPKSESTAEALWWRNLFQALAETKGLPRDYIKCMALVESHPLAYQIEEFIYNLRDHLVGLNLGRWDYMASLIHFNLQDPEWVLPDRNTIPHNVAFFQNLRELLAEVCHKRGILAIGGMTALYPSRTDAELNERALRVLAEDKKNEAGCLMDGAWTGHPDQNDIAVSQFPYPNQLHARRENAERYPDLRPVPHGVGNLTLDGTRAAVRTVIRYRNGVLNGKGASLLDGYMEDLATDRIYRLMIAQRMLHRDAVQVVDGAGQPVVHTPEQVSELFDEEVNKIIRALPPDTEPSVVDKYYQARRISELLIARNEFDPI
jgi:malate synthase